MFFNAPTLGLLLASPAFAAVLPLGARHVLDARQGGGGPFDGEATTFTGSPKSSCGAPLAADAIAVALNGDWQTGTSPNLAACGKQITITNGGNGLQGSIIQGSSKGKTITATVLDTCPECSHTHIDLTTGAWNALTDNSAGGVVGITWSFVGGAPSGGSTTPTSDSTPAAASSAPAAAASSSTSTNSGAGSGGGTGGAGLTVSKVAAQKVGTQRISLATVPQSGNLATTLQQTGTGSGNDTVSVTGDGTPTGTDQSSTGTGSTSSSASSTPASNSGTPSSGGTTLTGSGGGAGSGASGGVAGKFFQCGGSAWSGPTSCESGTTCQVQNQYYSQCL